MTWARLDDGFWMHPKILIAGNSAAGVFARMLSYSGCYLTDGLIPGPIVDQIVGRDRKTIGALEGQGLVEQLPTGALVISDYLEHNPSKEEVEAKREQRRINGAKNAKKNGAGI